VKIYEKLKYCAQRKEDKLFQIPPEVEIIF
jgi:hypothetical protein